MKRFHEFRDPIHTFIRVNTRERDIIDSRPFQRLRNISQLSLSYFVYPGATHRRFEHSLGVMELAGRVFDVVTRPENVHDRIRDIIPNSDDLPVWRQIVRAAALCHDIGHLPFSHTAEAELLPDGWDHERLSHELIKSKYLAPLWSEVPGLDAEKIVKLAVGPRKLKQVKFNVWEEVLSEIIVGDAFGVDRMDYLLRDSYHAGVAYGHFDHHRLIDTLRILPRSDDDSTEPALGVEEGGLHSAEALLLARYFMYTQVYFHPVRRAYDAHLVDFLRQWLPKQQFPVDVEGHLKISDAEVIAAMNEAAHRESSPGHKPAKLISERKHFKLVYTRNPTDIAVKPNACDLIGEALVGEFGSALIKRDSYRQKGGSPDFPVLMRDNRICSSISASNALEKIPVVAIDYVFAEREVTQKVINWLEKNRSKILNVGRQQ